MRPYGDRIPRVVWCENHGCPCCSSYVAVRKKNRKSSKVRARQHGKKMIKESVQEND